MKKLAVLLTAALLLFSSCSEKMPYNYKLSKYITLGQTEGIELPEKETVTDEKIVARINQMLSYLGNEVTLTSGSIKIGDYATFDASAYLGDSEIPELKKSDYMVKVGSFGIKEGFSDNFSGKSIGVQFKFDIEPGEELKEFSPDGKRITYFVTVNKVLRTIMPELTDEVISENTDYKTYNDYFNYAKTVLQNEIDENYDLDVDDTIWDVLSKTSEIKKIPSKEYKLYMKTRNHLYENLAAEENMELEDYVEYLIENEYVSYGTLDDFYADCESVAKNSVKTDLITMAVAEKYDLKLDDEAYEAWVENQMSEYEYQSVEEFKADFNDSLLRMVCLKANVSAFLKSLNS